MGQSLELSGYGQDMVQLDTITVSGLTEKESMDMDSLSTVLFTALAGEQFLSEKQPLFVSILYLFVINFVAVPVTVCLLISLWFPVNCSYLSLVCLPFVSHWRGWGQGSSLWFFTLVGALN